MKLRQIVSVVFAAGMLSFTTGSVAQEPIRIGVVTPLSGTYAPIGEQVRWGLELAREEINGSGGIDGRSVEFIFEDSEANPNVATRRAEQLFQSEDVDFLTGLVNSGATLAVGQVAERNDKLIATTVSVSDAITGDQCSPNVFRVNAPGGMQSTGLAAWIKQTRPDARVYTLGPDYEMGRNTVASFRQRAEEQELELVGEIFPPLGENDYSPYFGSLRQARPDVLYTSTAGNDTVRLFSQLQEYGLREQLTIVGASVAVTAQNIGAMGETAEGFVTVAGYSPDIDSDANRTFVNAFRDAYGTDPDLYGADSYGLLYGYKAAVENAGSTETDAVRDAMRGLSWDTPQGEKHIRAGDHQASMGMYVLEIVDGRFTIIDSLDPQVALGEDRCEQF